MPKCIVEGCHSHTSRKLQDSAVSLHSFPNNLDRIKLWLHQTGKNFDDLDSFAQRVLDGKKSDAFRICSLHFAHDSYRTKGCRKYLLPDALPTIFKRSGTRTDQEPGTSWQDALPPAKRKRVETANEYTFFEVTRQTVDFCTKPFHEVKHLSICSDPYGINVNTHTDPYCGIRKASAMSTRIMVDAWTSMEEIITVADKCVQYPEEEQWKIEHNQSYPKPDSLPVECMVIKTEPIFKDPVEQNMRDLLENDHTMECSLAKENKNKFEGSLTDVRTKIETDTLYEPLVSDDDLVREKKFIVFESSLDALLRRLPCNYGFYCQLTISRLEKKVDGTFLSVYGHCAEGHRVHMWHSQPLVGNIAAGNLLTSAALLFSGCSFKNSYEMFQLLGLQHITEKSFYQYQRNFLLPIIDMHWQQERQILRTAFRETTLSISGDSRCDRSLCGTKHCTYTVMELSTKKIVDFHIVQASETTPSVAMEKLAFCRSLDALLEDVEVHIIATEYHNGIKKLMHNRYNHLSHQYNAWHYGKKLRKKLLAASKKRGCQDLHKWIPAIINHLWYSSKACRGNVEELRERWQSLIYHIADKHEWEDGKLYKACSHKSYTQKEKEQYPWLQQESASYQALLNIIMDPQMDRDLEHLSIFCHGGEFTLYHSLLVKYLPKRIHLKMDAIEGRTKLAALAHNANIQRQQAKVRHMERKICSARSLTHNLEFTNIRNKKWDSESVYEYTAYAHVFPLIADVIRLSTGKLSYNWHPLSDTLP